MQRIFPSGSPRTTFAALDSQKGQISVPFGKQENISQITKKNRLDKL